MKSIAYFDPRHRRMPPAEKFGLFEFQFHFFMPHKHALGASHLFRPYIALKCIEMQHGAVKNTAVKCTKVQGSAATDEPTENAFYMYPYIKIT